MAKKIDAMIVGAPKSGTTSLLGYLGAHPWVHVPADIEFTAFDPRISPDHCSQELAAFLQQSRNRLAVAKHASAYHRPEEIDRILGHNPACRLILILRDPVQRAYSAFRMASLRGRARSTFSEAIDQALTLEAEGDREDYRVRYYLAGGRYADWCGELLARCNREQIAVLQLELFRRDPATHYRGLCEWLGLDSDFLPDFSARENVGGEARSRLLARGLVRLRSERNPAKRAARRVLSSGGYRRISVLMQHANKRTTEPYPVGNATEARLRGYFAESDARLAELLGIELSWRSAGHPGS
jgi:hypothetical protein